MTKIPGFQLMSINAVKWISAAALALLVVTSACSPQKKSGNNRSADTQGLAACDKFFDSATCTNSGNCEWTGSLCSGDATYCSKFVAEGNCPVSCRWNTSTSQCQPLPQQSQSISCGNYTSQQNCLQVSGCTWNGYNCITSGGTAGSTTGYNYPTTGYQNTTTGYQNTTTGYQNTTTGTTAPVSVCSTLDTWKCIITQGCRLAIFPSFGCVQMQQ